MHVASGIHEPPDSILARDQIGYRFKSADPGLLYHLWYTFVRRHGPTGDFGGMDFWDSVRIYFVVSVAQNQVQIRNSGNRKPSGVTAQ